MICCPLAMTQPSIRPSVRQFIHAAPHHSVYDLRSGGDGPVCLTFLGGEYEIEKKKCLLTTEKCMPPRTADFPALHVPPSVQPHINCVSEEETCSISLIDSIHAQNVFQPLPNSAG